MAEVLGPLLLGAVPISGSDSDDPLVWGRVCGGLAGGGSFPPLGACVGIEGFWGESRSVEAARERARLLVETAED